MPNHVEVTRVLHRTPLTPIRLGWQQLIVLVAGVSGVLLAVGIAFVPQWANLYIERVAIRSFEEAYGFKWGELRTNSTSATSTAWGVLAVVPVGAFSRLGLRRGDVPIEYYGLGGTAMHNAFVASARGEYGEFRVLNVNYEAVAAPREIKVPPLRSLKEASAAAPAAPSCWSDPRIPTILALGKDHAPDAHAKLKVIAGDAKESEGREMARVMLRNWDAREGHYRSSIAAAVVKRERLASWPEILKLAPRANPQGNTVLVEVQVETSGCATEGKILKIGPSRELADVILTRLLNQKFLPAKPGESYIRKPFHVSVTLDF